VCTSVLEQSELFSGQNHRAFSALFNGKFREVVEPAKFFRIAVTKVQKSLIGGVFVALVVAAIYEAGQVARLRHQVQMLQQQRQPLTGQVEQLIIERDGLKNKLDLLRQENEHLTGNTLELLKLRGTVSSLRRQLESQKIATARPLNNSTETSMADNKRGSYIAKDQLADVGLKTPEAALQTYFQAMFSGDYNRVVAAMSAQSGALDPREREAFEKGFHQVEEVSRLQGIQILGKKIIAEDRVDVGFLIYEAGKAPMLHVEQMVKEGADWKAGNSQGVDSSWGEEGLIQPLTQSVNQ
jgi:hypothetical protein